MYVLSDKMYFGMGMNFPENAEQEDPNKAKMETWSDKLKQVRREVWGEDADGEDNNDKPRVEISTDSRILGITCGNVYARIVIGESNDKQKPFHFYRYASKENPTSPKTEFYERKKLPFTPMDASEVEKEVEKEMERIRRSR